LLEINPGNQGRTYIGVRPVLELPHSLQGVLDVLVKSLLAAEAARQRRDARAAADWDEIAVEAARMAVSFDAA
jgi:hypothetical protein